jgi:hypothetical protein
MGQESQTRDAPLFEGTMAHLVEAAVLDTWSGRYTFCRFHSVKKKKNPLILMLLFKSCNVS